MLWALNGRSMDGVIADCSLGKLDSKKKERQSCLKDEARLKKDFTIFFLME